MACATVEEEGFIVRQQSLSAKIILEQLRVLGMNKTAFARRLGVSQDYVYRVLNGRIAFPHARETIERMAEICQLDPFTFAEYRELDEALSTSARLVWQRLRERGMTREDLFQAMGGRISRPYFNSILRGDQPFPSNRAYIQMFALALDLPPTAFKEFGHKHTPRWTQEELVEQEERSFSLFFDKMMADYGYARYPIGLTVLNDANVLQFFPEKQQLDAGVQLILERMGELGMGFKELNKVAGIPTDDLRRLFTDAEAVAGMRPEVETIQSVLHVAQQLERSEH